MPKVNNDDNGHTISCARKNQEKTAKKKHALHKCIARFLAKKIHRTPPPDGRTPDSFPSPLTS